MYEESSAGIKRIVLWLAGILLFLYIPSVLTNRVDIDIFLDKTSYALLLKELIGLSDTIGLLRCRLDKDERRFIEDSILGKVVRIQDILQNVDLKDALQDDLTYLHYWIALAKKEALSELLYKQLLNLEELFVQNFIVKSKSEGLYL